MVDISEKPSIFREATAEGKIKLKPQTIRLIKENKIEKGDVFTVSKIVAIQAAKNTSTILPLCHPIPITHVNVEFKIISETEILARVTVKTTAPTGVEMEALTAVSAALLNIWDMVKKYEKDDKGQYPTTRIKEIRVIQKIKIGNK